jgi:hypothetical protein
MPIATYPCHRPIDAIRAQLREQHALMTFIDRQAIEAAASCDVTTALRWALLASELRREMPAEMAL